MIKKIFFDFREEKVRQIIYVKAKGSRCTLSLYEGNPGRGYTQITGEVCGYVGKSGVKVDKREGDMATPAGLYPLLWTFGTAPCINTKMDYVQITGKSRWCCNPKSRRYNRPTDRRWERDCEDMWKYPREYAMGAVIGYNTKETTPYMGSAIFLHCKNSPTAGCVATDKYSLKNLLRRLDKRKNPHIFIKKC